MKLTDAEREALYGQLASMICYEKHHLHGGSPCSTCRLRAGAVHGPLVLIEVDRIVTAALAQQREALAAAIEQEACGCCDANPDGDCTEAEMRICERTLADAARIVREYQPGEGA